MKSNIYRIIVLTVFTFIFWSIAYAMSPGTEASVMNKLTTAHMNMMANRPDKASDPRYLFNLQKSLQAYRDKTGKPGSFSELASTVSERWEEVQRTRGDL